MRRVLLPLLLLVLLVLPRTPAAAEPPTLRGEPHATVGRPYTIELSGLPPGARGWYAHFDDGPEAGSWQEPGELRVTHTFTEPHRQRVIRCHFDDPQTGERVPIERLRIEVLTADGRSLVPPPPPPVVAQPLAPELQGVGLNLAFVNYYARDEPFTDEIKSFSPWRAQRRKPAGQWGYEDLPEGSLELRADGMPARLEPGVRAYALRDFPRGGAHGPHTLTWEGTGRLAWGLRPAGEARMDGFQAMRIDLPERPDGHVRVMLTLLETDPADPVRGLRLVRDDADPDALFKPGFLDRWSFAGSFRYMDWGETNHNPLQRWEDRPTPADWTWATDRGVPLEVQIAHANAAGADPWFCVPIAADDGYVRGMARLIRDTLDPSLVASIELSNEVWNWRFGQARYASERGEADPEITEAHHILWTVKRSLEVFTLFDEVFGEGRTPRIRRVLSAQSSNPWVATKVFESQAAVDGADALATAPYFGWQAPRDAKRRLDRARHAVREAGNDATAEQRRALGEAQAAYDAAVAAYRDASDAELDEAIREDLAETIRGIGRYPEIVAGVNARRDPSLPPLVHLAYEGGQHFLPPPGSHEDPEAMETFVRLGERPAFEDAYRDYLAAWHRLGGADLMLFSSMGAASHWGDWGLMRRVGQPLSETPKLRGVLRYLAEPRASPGG